MKTKEIKEGHYVRSRTSGNVLKVITVNDGTLKVDSPLQGFKGILVNSNEVRQETFLEFCFRPGGFGRTGWLAALVIHLGCIFIMVSPLIEEVPELGWRIFIPMFGAFIIFMVWFATYKNYKKQWN